MLCQAIIANKCCDSRRFADSIKVAVHTKPISAAPTLAITSLGILSARKFGFQWKRRAAKIKQSERLDQDSLKQISGRSHSNIGASGGILKRSVSRLSSKMFSRKSDSRFQTTNNVFLFESASLYFSSRDFR
jgi:hypothetical protein